MNITNKKPKNGKLKVIFAGTPDFASVSLQSLIDNQELLDIDIVAVYTQPDRKAGRGQKIMASSVKKMAVTYNIPVEQPATFKKFSKDENGNKQANEIGIQARNTLSNYQADIMIVVAYGLILPIGVLDTPRLGCLNIHGSLLPRWRGAAPIHRAILAGDDITGITIMQMDKGLDTGDILYKAVCPIADTDTTACLHDKLATLGAEAIFDVLKDLPTYQANAQKQECYINENPVTYAEKLSKEEGQINWQNTAQEIARQIRGMFPYPSTFSFINEKRVKIIKTLPVDNNHTSDKQIGTIININKDAITIVCGNNTCISLSELQFSGGKALTAEQISVGGKLTIGDRFDV